MFDQRLDMNPEFKDKGLLSMSDFGEYVRDKPTSSLRADAPVYRASLSISASSFECSSLNESPDLDSEELLRHRSDIPSSLPSKVDTLDRSLPSSLWAEEDQEREHIGDQNRMKDFMNSTNESRFRGSAGGHHGLMPFRSSLGIEPLIPEEPPQRHSAIGNDMSSFRSPTRNYGNPSNRPPSLNIQQQSAFEGDNYHDSTPQRYGGGYASPHSLTDHFDQQNMQLQHYYSSMNMGHPRGAARSPMNNRKLSRDRDRSRSDPVSSDGNVYQVHFKRAHRNFLLAPSAPRNLSPGDFVKVEADRGEDLGVVIARIPVLEFDEAVPTAGYRGRGFSSGQSEKKLVLRRASMTEREMLLDKVRDEERALMVIREKVLQRRLPMAILDAEYQFDRHKMIFFFEADRRIDFRELVSDLFSLYKTRIWMQQVDTTMLPNHEEHTRIAHEAGFLPSAYSQEQLLEGFEFEDFQEAISANPMMPGGRPMGQPMNQTLGQPMGVYSMPSMGGGMGGYGIGGGNMVGPYGRVGGGGSGMDVGLPMAGMGNAGGRAGNALGGIVPPPLTNVGSYPQLTGGSPLLTGRPDQGASNMTTPLSGHIPTLTPLILGSASGASHSSPVLSSISSTPMKGQQQNFSKSSTPHLNQQSTKYKPEHGQGYQDFSHERLFDKNYAFQTTPVKHPHVMESSRGHSNPFREGLNASMSAGPMMKSAHAVGETNDPVARIPPSPMTPFPMPSPVDREDSLKYSPTSNRDEHVLNGGTYGLFSTLPYKIDECRLDERAADVCALPKEATDRHESSTTPLISRESGRVSFSLDDSISTFPASIYDPLLSEESQSSDSIFHEQVSVLREGSTESLGSQSGGILGPLIGGHGEWGEWVEDGNGFKEGAARAIDDDSSEI